MDAEINKANIETCPTEILMKIFKFLNPKQLTLCRQVKLKWKNIIDEMLTQEQLWHLYCFIDFGCYSEVAYGRARPGVTWQHLYRDLTLWPKINQAVERLDKMVMNTQEEILGFQVLKRGVIGVHTKNAITYYHIDTLQPFRESPRIDGTYNTYIEDDQMIIALDSNRNLFLSRKHPKNNSMKDVTIDNVCHFLIAEQKIYYITTTDELCVCDLEDDNFACDFITMIKLELMAISCLRNKIYALTSDKNVYIVENKKMRLGFNLGAAKNITYTLHRYHFLDQVDFKVYLTWHGSTNTERIEYLNDIVLLRVYGKTVFLGSSLGVLFVYYFNCAIEYDFINKMPIKVYDFTEQLDNKPASYPIRQVDIIEGFDMHTLLVTLPDRIAVLDFKHNFNIY